jgi:glycosyltransferase involved in cell wall biosynthesis
MIKILHLVGLAHGGVGEHILSLANGCDPTRFDSTVAMSDASSMRPQFERSGIRVVPLVLDHFGGLRRNALAFGQIARMLRRERFDIIQTHTSVAGALGRVAARIFTDAPVVHMIHAFAAHPYRSAVARKAGVFIERRLDRLTDWYIAGSNAMVERGLKQGIFKRGKVVLIPNGIDLEHFPYKTADKLAGEAKSAKGGASATIGFLGRLVQQKGVPYLIRAARIVHTRNPRIRFVIAGDGGMRLELQRLAEELQVNDFVEFVGWQQDRARFLREIDVLAMPSLWEAFGLSAAEAMAMGKPVIASSVEGLREVVESGQTGILVSPADPEALARAIVDLAADPARQRLMGQRGRARVEAYFSLPDMIDRHEAFYERLADPRRVIPTADGRNKGLALALREEIEHTGLPVDRAHGEFVSPVTHTARRHAIQYERETNDSVQEQLERIGKSP